MRKRLREIREMLCIIFRKAFLISPKALMTKQLRISNVLLSAIHSMRMRIIIGGLL